MPVGDYLVWEISKFEGNEGSTGSTNASFSLDANSCSSFLASPDNMEGQSNTIFHYRVLNRLVVALEISIIDHGALGVINKFLYSAMP